MPRPSEFTFTGGTKRRPYKYDTNFALQIVDLARNGLSMMQIADKWNIHESSFWQWAYKDSDKPEFREAYARARQAYGSALKRKTYDGIDGKFFNHNAVNILFALEGKNARDRTVRLPDLDGKSFTEKTEIILQEVKDGELTPFEGDTIINMISKSSKIDEVENLRKRVDELVKAQETK